MLPFFFLSLSALVVSPFTSADPAAVVVIVEAAKAEAVAAASFLLLCLVSVTSLALAVLATLSSPGETSESVERRGVSIA